MHSLIKRHSGFTMVELTIAVSILSVLMVATTLTMIDLFHIYQKGIAVRATQKNARLISDAINKDASEAELTSAASSPNRLCLFTNRNNPGKVIVYYLSGTTIMRVEAENVAPGNCVGPAGGQNISTAEVSVLDFSATPSPVNRLIDYQVSVVANSNLTDYDNATKTCRNLDPGAQFCSVTTLVGSVNARGQVSGG
jgi:prepilin-type N-terminal cleavage/methylation domain-containing protein